MARMLFGWPKSGRHEGGCSGLRRYFCDGYHIAGGKYAQTLSNKISSGRKNAQLYDADRRARDTGLLFSRKPG
jgi:hypothetical protein